MLLQANFFKFPLRGNLGKLEPVREHRQCLLFLSFDTPGGCVGVPIAYAICLEHKILNENIKSIYGTTRGLTKGNT